MAFDKKTWKDRDVQYPGKRTLTNINDNSDFQNVIVERAEGTVTEPGDLYCASVMNDLEQRIFNAFNEVFTALSEEVNTIYPIGAVYQSFSNISPATIFPGTTWVPIVDKLLLPVSTSDTSPENRGNPSHTVTIPTYSNKQVSVNGQIAGTALSESQIPPHTHQYTLIVYKYGPGPWANGYSASQRRYDHSGHANTDSAGKGYAHSHNLNASGTFAENPTVINIDQPYITMYAWRRTA